MDMVTGLRLGFLSNVDYRMYTDNINWEALPLLHGARLTPRQINRTLFISEWDNAVVRELQHAWTEQPKPTSHSLLWHNRPCHHHARPDRRAGIL